MNKNLKRISCDPMCGFMVQSHDEKEVVDLAKQHVKHAHPEMKVTTNDLTGMMKNVK